MNILHFLMIAVIGSWLSVLPGEAYAVFEGGGCTGTVPVCPPGFTAQCNANLGLWGCVQSTTTTIQTSAPTPTAGSGPAKTGLAPPQNKTVYYTTITSTARPLLTGGSGPLVEAYVACPNDPGLVIPTPSTSTLESSYTDTTNYGSVKLSQPPDLKEYYATGTSSSDFPNQCIVTSRVYYTQSDGSIKDGTTQPQYVTNNISRTFTAVCPVGYIQIGSYNMQPEVKYNPTTITVSPTTLAAYNSLNEQGYQCANGQQNTLWSNCKDQGTPGGGILSWTFNVPLNTPYEVTAGQTSLPAGSDAISNSFPIAGVVKFNKLYYPYQNNAYMTYGTDCNNPSFFASSPNCTASPTSNGETMICGWVVQFRAKAYYEYYYQSCTLPSGFYKTGNSLPATLICARMQPTYHKMNK